MTERHIGILGGGSFVGTAVLSQLNEIDAKLFVFSRDPFSNCSNIDLQNNITWIELAEKLNDYSRLNSDKTDQEKIEEWIFLTPVWVLPDYFIWLNKLGVKRVVAVSSTSRFTKSNSTEEAEITVANKLIDGEEKLIQWATEHDIEWIILRPTLIYGGGKDKNISVISRFIERFRFFPIFGKAQGLRQPVHVDDVAMACINALNFRDIKNFAYNLSGGETLPYKEMISRIFLALNRKPRLFHFPRWGFQLILLGLRLMPRYRNWNIAMVDRMEKDIVFDHDEATRDLDFNPKSFVINEKDLPQ